MNDDLDDRPSEGSDPVGEGIRMVDPKRRFTRALRVVLVLLLAGAGVGATINYYDLTLPWHHDDTEAYPSCHAVPTMAGSIDPAFEIHCLTDDGLVRLYRTATTTTTRPAATTTTVPTPSPPFSGEELDYLNALAVLHGWDLRVSEQGIHRERDLLWDPEQGIHRGWDLTPWLQDLDEDWYLLGVVLRGRTWCVGGAHDELRGWERVDEDPDATEGRRAWVFAALAYLC